MPRLPLCRLAAFLLLPALHLPAALARSEPSCGPSPAGSPCAEVQVAGLDTTGGAPQGAGNPVNIITGNKYQRETDMAPLPGPLGLELVRHYNSRLAAPGMLLQGLGHGWTLSYDTRLYAVGNTLQIVQADGARIIFARSMLGQGLCTSRDPGQGTVRIVRLGRDRLYRWRWADGRELRFDMNGRLSAITDAGGATLIIERFDDGRILQVIDPQGRRMTFNYLLPAQYRSGAYPGVHSVDTPLGRFLYDYDDGGPGAKAARPARLSAVHLPTRDDPAFQPPRRLGEPRAASSLSTVRRLYHYEDARLPTHLTGVSVAGAGNDGQPMHERIATWAYDRNGLAVMSARGTVIETGPGGKPVTSTGTGAGAGIEQLRFDRSEPGRTRIVNSLGQATVYRHAIVAGAFRVLEARGAGCASCGPVNLRYRYDKLGRLEEVTWLDRAGLPLAGWRQGLDSLGRQYVLVRIDYAGGRKTGQTVLLNRLYPFPDRPARLLTAATPQNRLGPDRIATDSALAGQRHATVIRYNAEAQPQSITETGYNPLDGSEMVRTTRYRYEEIGGRSMLVETDGPLPNGALGTPADSDITRYEWDRRADMLLSVTAPGGLTTRFDYGAAGGRLAAVTGSDGSVTRYRYDLAFLDRPTVIERDGRSVALAYDALGRLRRVSDLPAIPGRSARFDYDSAGRLVTISDAQGYRQQLGLDSEGGLRMAALYAPGGDAPLRAAYRMTEPSLQAGALLLPDGRLHAWHLQPAHAGTAAQGGQAGQIGQAEQAGKVALTDADGARHGRLALGTAMLDSVRGPDGALRVALDGAALPGADASEELLRDDFGRVVQIRSSIGGVRTFRHDLADRPLEVLQHGLDGKLAWRDVYVHDVAGRLRERSTYDGDGKLSARLARDYAPPDQGGRLVAEEDDAQQRRHRYDERGLLVASALTFTGDDGQPAWQADVATAHDSRGDVLHYRLADDRVLRIVRDDSRSPQAVVLHGPWSSRIGLAAQRLLPPATVQSLWRWLPGARVADSLALHPFDGLAAYRHGNGIATTLAHDAAGRLTALKVDGVFERRLRYGVGPRVTAAEDSLPAIRRVSYDYNALGMLRSSAPAPAQAGPLLRDSLGNAASDGRHRYRYTPAGQIAAVAGRDGRTLAHYRYDALGQRVAKTVYPDGEPPRTTWYLWQQGRLAAEIAGSGAARGTIQAQYLYLNAGGRALPLAKLESAAAEGNRSGRARLLYIHNDQRGAPVAMTDSERRVVWRAEVDVWGWATPSADNEAMLNLRLPGQYFDAETGLADNHHRSYDARPASPLRGNYLSPDPLGHTDGGNRYRYAGGDPVNRIDPAGLYQVDMHYYMTFFLAIMAGVDYQSARVTALAAQYIDDNVLTRPLDDANPVGSVAKNQQQLLLYHFVLSDATGKVLPAYRNADARAPVGFGNYSPQLRNLAGASQRAGGCARYQLLGEFLHAYADTFSHRDQADQPYDALFVGLGLGHGGALSEPDYTYDAPASAGSEGAGWSVREARTLQAEHAMFDVLRQHATGVKSRSWVEIAPVLVAFNATKEDEQNSGKAFSQKLKILQDALNDPKWGMKAMKKDGSTAKFDFKDVSNYGYEKSIAETNRESLLKTLKEADFPGVCLPQGTLCKPF